MAVKTIILQFLVTQVDVDNSCSDLFDEQKGFVAVAFKRQFPKEKFVRAHGDYYIGIGKSHKNDKRYYLKQTVDSDNIHRVRDEGKIDKPFLLTATHRTTD